MNTLLTKLQQRAVDRLSYLGGEKAVHILVDEDLLPAETPFPCVGLKDGAVSTKHYVGAKEKWMTVEIIGYVQVNSPDGPILGDSAQKGIIELVDDLKAAFENYEPTGHRWVPENNEVPETPSVPMPIVGEESRLVQKKKFTMRWYRKEVDQ